MIEAWVLTQLFGLIRMGDIHVRKKSIGVGE